MKIRGTKAAYMVTFGYFNVLGLDDKSSYELKKGREVEVSDVVAKSLVKAGYAEYVKVPQVKVEKIKQTIHKKKEGE